MIDRNGVDVVLWVEVEWPDERTQFVTLDAAGTSIEALVQWDATIFHPHGGSVPPPIEDAFGADDALDLALAVRD